jgi:hypothetical protein
LALYLLLAIGFRGGVELHQSGIDGHVVAVLLAAMGMAVVVPGYTYSLLRRRLDPANAAAVAATYGSVSAVTFITATAWLRHAGLPFGGHMVAAMALMESPAIIVGVALARMSQGSEGTSGVPWAAVCREACVNGSVFVLVGSLLIGMITGAAGAHALHPFLGEIFTGVLCLFLLDMGLVSARHLGDWRALGIFPLGFATVIPLVNAALGIGVAWGLGVGVGDALLFCVLCASASYIAVPAAVRLAIPEANPGLYVTMALAVTFPFNLLIGLPLYMVVIQSVWR